MPAFGGRLIVPSQNGELSRRFRYQALNEAQAYEDAQELIRRAQSESQPEPEEAVTEIISTERPSKRWEHLRSRVRNIFPSDVYPYSPPSSQPHIVDFNPVRETRKALYRTPETPQGAHQRAWLEVGGAALIWLHTDTVVLEDGAVSTIGLTDEGTTIQIGFSPNGLVTPLGVTLGAEFIEQREAYFEFIPDTIRELGRDSVRQQLEEA